MNTKWKDVEHYNKDTKAWYLRDSEESFAQSTKKSFDSLFRKTAPFEAELSKDICNFSTEEIYDMLKRFNSSSTNSLEKYCRLLSLYVQWCNQQGMVTDSQNHFLEIKTEQLRNCTNAIKRQKKYIDRNTILGWCEQVQPMDNMVLLCLFEGILGSEFEEVRNLRMRDFKDDGYVDLSNGKRKRYSPELKECARKSMLTGYYVRKNWKKVDKEYPVYSSYDDGCYKITEGSEWDANDFMIKKRLYVQVSSILNDLEVPYMNMSDIQLSGLAYSLKERARELGVKTVKEMISTKVAEDILFQHDMSETWLYNTMAHNKELFELD